METVIIGGKEYISIRNKNEFMDLKSSLKDVEGIFLVQNGTGNIIDGKEYWISSYGKSATFDDICSKGEYNICILSIKEKETILKHDCLFGKAGEPSSLVSEGGNVPDELLKICGLDKNDIFYSKKEYSLVKRILISADFI